MDPSIGIMDDGDLLIDDGKIIAIGQKLGSWAVMEIDGRGMIAMPGLINGHIHLWQTALRGVAADWTLDQYFGVLIGQVVRLYTPEDVYIGNLVGALDQINSGVTTLFDWCHMPACKTIDDTGSTAALMLISLLRRSIRSACLPGVNEPICR